MPDDFYVGYLPLPARHRKALMLGVPVAMVLLVAGVIAMGLAQRDPGGGIWESGEARPWEGTLVADPFPRLVTDDGTLFLVEFGKIGSQDRTEGLVGKRVRASGWLLERDGRRIVELEHGDESLVEIAQGDAVASPIVLGDRTFVGEILDFKCYLGAMKPGDGKAHKACATLCISGGIPPSLVVRDDTGNVRHFIVIAESGGRADDLILDVVAEPVRVTGQVERRGDVFFMRARDVSRR